jgi:hypothetical protein
MFGASAVTLRISVSWTGTGRCTGSPATNGSSKVIGDYVGEPPEQFFSAHISGAERQPNDNVLICEGAYGRVFEITRRGETVWEWVSPFATSTQRHVRAWVFRAYRSATDFPGLQGRSLDPAEYAEVNRVYGLQD